MAAQGRAPRLAIEAPRLAPWLAIELHKVNSAPMSRDDGRAPRLAIGAAALSLVWSREHGLAWGTMQQRILCQKLGLLLQARVRVHL